MQPLQQIPISAAPSAPREGGQKVGGSEDGPHDGPLFEQIAIRQWENYSLIRIIARELKWIHT
jgi:hypothetical protein